MAKGNPRRKKPRESTLATIDRLLSAKFKHVLDGKPVEITVLEMIMLHLFQKELAGSNRAARILMKYEDFARPSGDKRLELEFVDDGYTRSLTEDIDE